MNANPEDGMVVEVFPGVFYQYHENENSWICITGYQSIKEATQIESGLMTKEDFIKVDSLLTSPPKTTLTSDQCNTTFDSGVIKFYSKDHSLFLEDYLDLYGNNESVREQWHIHEDTWGFNFRVNLQFLVEEMRSRGNLISQTVTGPKGPTGDRGAPGINKLDTGPKGEKGDNGTNAPFDGALSNTSGLVLKDKSKAVVDVDTEMISPNENYLVVYKGTISPEKLCTKKVSVENRQSTWVLVRNQQGIVCNDGCITSVSCEDETAFLDIEIIIDSIKNHTNNLILKLKEEKEAQVREWLRTMMKVFNDQKYSLCCGLENCYSRKRNQDERRYIESSRIAAMAADFNLIISGSRDGEDEPEPHSKVEIDNDEFKECIGPGWQPTVVEPVTPTSKIWNIPEIVIQDGFGGSPGSMGAVHAIPGGVKEFDIINDDPLYPGVTYYVYTGNANTGNQYWMNMWPKGSIGAAHNTFAVSIQITINQACEVRWNSADDDENLATNYSYYSKANCRLLLPPTEDDLIITEVDPS